MFWFSKWRGLRTNQTQQVSEKIGKGAYGGVWQATVLDTKQEVVVKVVWPDADLDPEDAKKESPGQHRKDAFKREIEMMRRVGKHPNIICMVGATADSTVIVFEEALTDLHVIIKKQKRSLSLPIVVRVTRDILLGVEYLHSINVVHRDLKPANILVFKDMTCKLGDFGLAREFVDTTLTVKNEVSTLWYRAPELLMGSATYTPKIDEWSSGCITLEMLTGRCPLMGRVEDVCDCPQQTHYNFNSDQLLKVFHLVGTPTDQDLLSKMHCLKHFQSWPKHRATLDTIVTNMCTASRFRSADKPVASEEEVAAALPQWIEMMQAMLCTDPRKRWSSTQVLELPLLAVKKAAASAAPSKQTGASSTPDGGGMFQRTQSVPVPAAVTLNGSSATISKDATHATVTKPAKKLLLNPFRRVASGGASTSTTSASSQQSKPPPAVDNEMASKMGELSTADRSASSRPNCSCICACPSMLALHTQGSTFRNTLLQPRTVSWCAGFGWSCICNHLS